MDMYLQFGYGMMSLADELLKSWKGGGIVLSPRDLEPEQLGKVAKSAARCSAEVLLDPQCYVHAADHKRLISYKYWDGFGGQDTTNLISTKNVACLAQLYDLNKTLGCSALVLPGLYAETLNDLWWAFHEEQLNGALGMGLAANSVVPTLALGAGVVGSESAIEEISERVKTWGSIASTWLWKPRVAISRKALFG
ncbi:hypothetical protein CNO08_02580 [Lysobacter capsici]|nr:hypothetical protein CNO08_02580 [Lysobacter capsici]